jgi:ATP-dependent Clp protease adapter protein ClpS
MNIWITFGLYFIICCDSFDFKIKGRKFFSSQRFSTIVKPKRTDKTIKKDIEIEVPNSPNIFKESRDFQKEIEDFFEEDKYAVILYNDPYNKRIYVATCLMQVFSWTEERAAEVMMQAHNFGFAVTGEWFKELAEDYCVQLVTKGLIAEVKAMKEVTD